jgi:hypothetical protein
MLATASLAFRVAGPELLANMVNALRTFPQKPYGNPAHASGKTERALSTNSGDDFLELLGPAHAQALISGRKPTSSGAQANEPRLHEILAQWAKDKGLVPKRNQTYEQLGRALAYRIHREGTGLYRAGGDSGIFQSVLTRQFLDKLLAQVAAGEMVAISSALTQALQGS